MSKMEKADETVVDSQATCVARDEPRTVHEASPVGSSQSNGFIERAIQDEEGQIRTIKSDLESRIQGAIPSSHNLVPWLVEYAAVLLNRGQVGSDGKTAYERLKGKKASLPGLQFGERILWKSNVPSYKRKDKMDSDWNEGVFLGQRTVSGEYLVGSTLGVFRPRTVRKVPLEQRWVDNLSLVSCLPWKHNSRHEAGDEVLLAEEPPTPSLVPESTPLPPRTIEEPSMRDIRQFYVHQPDVDPAGGGIGFTDGCKGCRAIVFGTTRTGHDNHCRHRVIKTAATNPLIAARVKVAVDRDVAWHAKKLEASETSRRKPEITSS